jgi:hypothetical protein
MTMTNARALLESTFDRNASKRFLIAADGSETTYGQFLVRRGGLPGRSAIAGTSGRGTQVAHGPRAAGR